MANTLNLPVGIENFEEIRQLGFYYIDKTRLIEQLLQGWGKVTLFTRPRRFGKTLNMSMLKSFFEIGADKTLFDGLYISGNKELCAEYMGKYPVIFLSLKGVDGLDFTTARRMLCAILKNELDRHYYLKTSDALRIGHSSARCFRKLMKILRTVYVCFQSCCLSILDRRQLSS